MSNFKKQLLESEHWSKLIAYWLLKKANKFADKSQFKIQPGDILRPNTCSSRIHICDIPRPSSPYVASLPPHISYFPPPPPALSPASAISPPPPPPPAPSLQSFSSSESSCPE